MLLASDEFECSVRAEEIPEIPAPKFLYRGNLDADKEEAAVKKESNDKYVRSFISMAGFVRSLL